jgi:hypothetical protein
MEINFVELKIARKFLEIENAVMTGKAPISDLIEFEKLHSINQQMRITIRRIAISEAVTKYMTEIGRDGH